MTIKKTEEQIKTVIKNLRAEADNLPEFTFFGDDNTDDIHELRTWATELEAHLDGRQVVDDQVRYWLDGQDSDLTWYETEEWPDEYMTEEDV